ncbi:MAG TPA: biotin/lipoyl-binding protein [Bacteroidales bacterium]|jgi:biotin carboxyl carrier protein|nr:biotin/lipoyl-binding protein [Bacteroidales bacterium]OPZ57050.1 MAG: 2-oxoglutarate carboxylase large subunit [Bacteroidetes bacterium ADurb.BinA012]HNV66601.1 biotin/lipoyl-binding protein [Bacteroidales bacterium]HOC03979.1 biotin/lipoyl-binding protein [Bacteroidales bacterium]HOE24165.1 biotin/lipoyl-binding protein [Bacteroidales bacterium]
MKNFKFKINGNQYDVEVLGIDGSMARIDVNGTVYDVEMQRDTPKTKAVVSSASTHARPLKETKEAPESASGKATEIKAPLPGIIIQVLVKVGDDVKPGQTVCTLETMKMENAIKAETAGKVTAVNVSPSQSVLQDEVLVALG